jgi:hypothetical protein
MKRKDYYNILNKELAASTINGDGLLSIISDYERETLLKSLYNRFLDPADAIQVLRRGSNWGVEENKESEYPSITPYDNLVADE